MMLLDSHIEGAQLFGPKVRGELYRAIIEYGYYGTEPDWLKGEALGFFVAIKPTLDTKKARSDAGRKSGAKRRTKREQTDEQNANKTRTNDEQTTEQNANKSEAIAEQNANEEEEEVEVKKNSLSGVPRSPRFSPPSVGEVSAYATEYGHPSFDASRFVDHYASNGWRVGKSPMKDWKAAVRNWIRRDEPPSSLREVADERYSEYTR